MATNPVSRNKIAQVLDNNAVALSSVWEIDFMTHWKATRQE
jgi:hypothetical protein